MNQGKHCQHCGCVIVRRPGYSALQWEGTKYCSRRCAAHSTHASPLERFVRNVTIDPITRCWIWGAGTDTAGYGLLSELGAHKKAHLDEDEAA